MSGWLSGLLCISVLSVLLSILMKGNRLYRVMQGVLTLILAIYLIQPLVTLKNEGVGGDFVWQTGSFEENDVLLTFLEEQRKTHLEKKIENHLARYRCAAEVVLHGDFSADWEIQKVLVKIDKSVINQMDMNIVELRQTVALYCNVNEEDVTVYGGTDEKTK